jgi:hypothetical protein
MAEDEDFADGWKIARGANAGAGEDRFDGGEIGERIEVEVRRIDFAGLVGGEDLGVAGSDGFDRNDWPTFADSDDPGAGCVGNPQKIVEAEATDVGGADEAGVAEGELAGQNDFGLFDGVHQGAIGRLESGL